MGASVCRSHSEVSMTRLLWTTCLRRTTQINQMPSEASNEPGNRADPVLCCWPQTLQAYQRGKNTKSLVQHSRLGKTSKAESEAEEHKRLWRNVFIQRTVLGSQWGKISFTGSRSWPRTQQKNLTPKCSFGIRDSGSLGSPRVLKQWCYHHVSAASQPRCAGLHSPLASKATS